MVETAHLFSSADSVTAASMHNDKRFHEIHATVLEPYLVELVHMIDSVAASMPLKDSTILGYSSLTIDPVHSVILFHWIPPVISGLFPNLKVRKNSLIRE
jgi:hypothetical protein